MIRPTCANCKEEMKCEKNEVAVIHFVNDDKKQGIDAIRFGDIWKCSKCKCRVVIGMGQQKLGSDFPEERIKKLLKQDYIEIKRADKYENIELLDEGN